ncbi:MAG TPA: UDP-3-O-acyl-N-acetylglucosamine deacetylase, partial [Candidatus Spyradosoma merdigallinarum]|nr:UDP-3-O-acyl-N-acetylglucosamine deacetylase [Candidatus Spyradosoma merdigallinarum]
MKQRTIQKEVSIRGKALHTGKDVMLTLKPAPVDTGIVFCRTDLYGKPKVRPLVDLVLGSEMQRQTTVEQNHIKLHTIEHVNSALNGMGVDNCIVELNE